MATWTGIKTARTVYTDNVEDFNEEVESGVWRKTVCDRCECGVPLQFLEGPLCDRCLDEEEIAPPGFDRYAHLQNAPTRTNNVPYEPETPLPPCRGRDKLSVNLETHEITLFRREATKR